MGIRKDGSDYIVQSSSSPGKTYKVDPEKPWCDCPAYKFRHLKSGGKCKHIKAVLELIAKSQDKGKNEDNNVLKNILKYIEESGGEVESTELLDMFGEKKINDLIHQGELIEYKGKIKILK